MAWYVVKVRLWEVDSPTSAGRFARFTLKERQEKITKFLPADRKVLGESDGRGGFGGGFHLTAPCGRGSEEGDWRLEESGW